MLTTWVTGGKDGPVMQSQIFYFVREGPNRFVS